MVVKQAETTHGSWEGCIISRQRPKQSLAACVPITRTNQLCYYSAFQVSAFGHCWGQWPLVWPSRAVWCTCHLPLVCCYFWNGALQLYGSLKLSLVVYLGEYKLWPLIVENTAKEMRSGVLLANSFQLLFYISCFQRCHFLELQENAEISISLQRFRLHKLLGL